MAKKRVTQADLASIDELLTEAGDKINDYNESPPQANANVGQGDPCVESLIDARDAVSAALSELGGRPCGGGRPC